MLAYCIVASVGYRNKLGAVFVAATVLAAQWLGIGIGAPIAQMAAALGALSSLWATAAMAIIFFTFNYIGLRNFSFDRAVETVLPAHADENTSDENTSENTMALEAKPSRVKSASTSDKANELGMVSPAAATQPVVDPIDEACSSVATSATGNSTNREKRTFCAFWHADAQAPSFKKSWDFHATP